MNTRSSSPPAAPLPPADRGPTAPSAGQPGSRLRSMALIGAGLLVLTVLIEALIWHWLSERVYAMRGQEPPRSAMARQAPPPEPRLQGSAVHRTLPRQDLVELRRQEDARLTGYAWVDVQAKIVRIPIERAMDLLAERGLPVPVAATQPEAAGTGPRGAAASQPATRPALHEP